MRMAYIFDTNIFIRSKNEMPMEIWPTFWRRMTEIKIPDACNAMGVRFCDLNAALKEMGITI